jgi:hypothetical protein
MLFELGHKEHMSSVQAGLLVSQIPKYGECILIRVGIRDIDWYCVKDPGWEQELKDEKPLWTTPSIIGQSNIS